jgi:hypothetical protein
MIVLKQKQAGCETASDMPSYHYPNVCHAPVFPISAVVGSLPHLCTPSHAIMIKGNESAWIYTAASAAIVPRMRVTRLEQVFALPPVAGIIGGPVALPVAAQLVPNVVTAPVGTAPVLVA